MNQANWIFRSYLPDSANLYCFDLWHKHQFQIKLSAPRKTKLGDYRYRPQPGTHLITVNRNLNQFAFLVVYLHEVAHFLTHIRHGIKVKPHGPEWQQEIRRVMTPLLNGAKLPQDILEAFTLYLKAPKAASCSHPVLTRVLRKYDPVSPGIPLEQIPEGDEFLFRSRKYKKIKVRRTRTACLETANNRRWLISNLALVLPVDN